MYVDYPPGELVYELGVQYPVPPGADHQVYSLLAEPARYHSLFGYA